MPTREAIVDSIIPREVEKPIPVRTISTRPPKPKTPEIVPGRDHSDPIREAVVADSSTPPLSPVDAADSSPTKLSPQLSALARKEQAHRQKEAALKERERSLEARLALAEKYSQLETGLKSKDFSALESLGLSYEDYTKYLLDKQSTSSPEQEAFRKTSAEVEALKKSLEENNDREYKETVAEYRKEINSLVDKDPAFSSVKELKRQDAVLQLILDSWEEDSEEITVEQALKLVEDYSVDEAKQFTSLSKLKPAPKVEESAKPIPKPGLKTLTNQVTVASNEKRPTKSLQFMSESERYAEARRRVLERKQQQQGN